jgi:hypothetical protein
MSMSLIAHAQREKPTQQEVLQDYLKATDHLRSPFRPTELAKPVPQMLQQSIVSRG